MSKILISEDEYEAKHAEIIQKYLGDIAGDSEKIHRTAIGWNWDSGVNELATMISDPACDLSTALEVFTLAQPEECFLKDEELEGEELQMKELLQTIIDNVEKGFYKTSQYKFPSDGFDIEPEYKNWQKQFADGTLEINLGKVFFTPIEGKELEGYEYEGFPEHIFALFNQLDQKYEC